MSAAGRQCQQPLAAGHLPLAEIVLECVHAEGVNLSMLEPGLRSIAFAVESGKASGHWVVGRQLQPEFFVRVCNSIRERMAYISRSHFEFLWDAPSCALCLRKLSSNSLLLNGKQVSSSESAAIEDGTRISFIELAETARQFVVLVVRLRSLSDVRASGPHPAIRFAAGSRKTAQAPMPTAYGAPAQTLTAPPPLPPQTLSPAPVHTTRMAGGIATALEPPLASTPAAFLECINSIGCDVRALNGEARIIPLASDGMMELGRQHQAGFFEKLLQVEPQWLAYISRNHLRVRLSSTSPGCTTVAGRPVASPCDKQEVTLRVENLSSNVVLVNRRTLAKGKGEAVLPEGGTIAFVARGAERDEPTVFLELRLTRRSRS
jgi:hypothetical protein